MLQDLTNNDEWQFVEEEHCVEEEDEIDEEAIENVDYCDENHAEDILDNVDENLNDPPGDSDDEETVVASSWDFTLNISHKIKLLLLLAVKLRHKLTYAAALCFVQLAGVWCEGFSFSPSKHILKSAISAYSSTLSVHHMCPNCKLYVGEIYEDSALCLNCSTEINAKLNNKQNNIFLYNSIADQIKLLLVHGGLMDELIKPENRSKINHENYEDIFDGKLYKELVNENCISFNFFVDGMPVSVFYFSGNCLMGLKINLIFLLCR